jgi:hypothetical protein
MTMAPVTDERRFGLSVGAVLGLLALIAHWRGRTEGALALGVVAAVLLGAGLVAPRLLRGPSRLWMRLGHGLAWINTRVLLTLFFVLAIMPMGLVLRAGGRDVLGRRGRRARVGWAPYPARRRDPRHYERMY